MTSEQREQFDRILEGAIERLPDRFREWIEEVPVVVEDRPSSDLVRDLGMDDDEGLAGLHSGISLTERSVEDHAGLPDEIRIFREGVVDLAGGWSGPDAPVRLAREIRITLLHELGHHFGLDEDDLADLGYD